MSAQIESSSFELGFSKNLLNKIQSSKLNLDAFLQRQTSTFETIQSQNDLTYASCQDKIQAKMNELKMIQRQRGVMSRNMDTSTNTEEEKDDFDVVEEEEEESNDTEGIAQKIKMLQVQQIELERKIANLTLEQKQVRNQVQSKCIHFYILDLHIDEESSHRYTYISIFFSPSY
jgi:TATA-binding protein-associated factor Taf7